MRIAIGIEYDGSGFAGWQRQSHARSVQACVEAALARIAGHPVATRCAGRTDAGVHACGQVVHFDTGAARPERAWVLGTNAHLPGDVAVRWARAVEEGFDARFSATARVYRYLILEGPARPALLRHRAAWHHGPRLDEARMAEAARALVGEHDFSAFRAAGCQARHAVRTVARLEVGRAGDVVWLEIEANAFLHHMVRIVAGSLLLVGRGERPVEWIGELLAGRDRAAAGPTAPAAGLYLLGARYPARFGLPGPAAPAWLPGPGAGVLS